MPTELRSSPLDTLAELVEQLGHVPLDRIRLRPAPGTATESDVVEIECLENRLCELVDGTLVEKSMGYRESLLAGLIVTFLNQHVLPRRLGLVTGADGTIRLFPGLVRIPDVAFVSWKRIPKGRVPQDPIPDLAPDLVVEVLSRTNTPEEMRRKRGEYFSAGVQLVWILDPVLRTATVFTAPEESQTVSAEGLLAGEPVLPGFSLDLRELFRYLDQLSEPTP